MKVDLILVCEDPNFGRRGHRKFWAASYETNGDGSGPQSVQTRWGRIPDGHKINVAWLRGQQHKSVVLDNDEKAIKFIDKKAAEKAEKGYQVVVHEVDGINIALLHGSAADEHGYIHMATYRGTN